MAGMMAAAELAENSDLEVAIYEKAANLGGNLPYTGGVIMGFNESTYPEVADSEEFVNYFRNLYQENINLGFIEKEDFTINEELIYNAFSLYGKPVKFMLDAGVPFPDSENFNTRNYGGTIYSNFLSITGADEGSDTCFNFLQAITDKLENYSNVHIFTNAEVIEVLNNENTVTGIKLKDGSEINTPNVILATGGIADSEEYMKEYNPGYIGHINYTTGLSTGDGITMTRKFRTEILGIGALGGFVSSDSTWVPLRSYFMIDGTGNRFVNEAYSDYITSYIAYSEKRNNIYMICDQNYADANPEEIELKLNENDLLEFDSLESLCENLNIQYEQFQKTVNAYNEAIANKANPEFDLDYTLGNQITKAPFYAERQEDYFFDTFTGIKANEKAQILNGNNEIIEGLYGAGQLILCNAIEIVYAQGGTGLSFAAATGTLAANTIIEKVSK